MIYFLNTLNGTKITLLAVILYYNTLSGASVTELSYKNKYNLDSCKQFHATSNFIWTMVIVFNYNESEHYL